MTSHVFTPRTFHPKACRCGHGENLHPPRLGYACRRPSCLCTEFEPVRGPTLLSALSVSKKRRNLTLDGLAK